MAVRCQPGGGIFEACPQGNALRSSGCWVGFARESLPPHLAILTFRLLMLAAPHHLLHRKCTPLKALDWKGTHQDSSKGNRETPVLRPAWPLNLYGWCHHVGGSEYSSSRHCIKTAMRKGPGFRAPPGRRGKHGPFGKCLTAWPTQMARTTVPASSRQ